MTNMSIQATTTTTRLLTYAIGCIVGQGVRVYYILVAKYLHHLVKELAFLFVSSGNRKQNFRVC